jgi:DNA-binding protein H-NS
MKTIGNSSVKVRQLEEKIRQLEKEAEKEKRRSSEECKQLKERMEVIRKMNFNLQKLVNLNKRKADQADSLIKRCIDLERAN